MVRYLSVILLSIVLFSCSESSLELSNFEKDAWARDKNGCGGTRKSMIESILNQKGELLGAEQEEITKLLGKPDKHELYRRSQYFFIYFVDPGDSCADYDNKKTANLAIRFNALGRVNEVVYYQ